jgi:polar amino acid transport system substrate-binding protein
MHDIGKIGLPPHILTKPGKLTNQEFSQIRLHPGKGWEIVRRLKGLDAVSTVIRHHHERFDGVGYPDRLAGEVIPLESRIISVADTFDALTSERPYRRELSIAEAEAELRRVAGSQLDPACVETFLKLLKSGNVSLKRRSDQVPEPVA